MFHGNNVGSNHLRVTVDAKVLSKIVVDTIVLVSVTVETS